MTKIIMKMVAKKIIKCNYNGDNDGYNDGYNNGCNFATLQFFIFFSGARKHRKAHFARESRRDDN